MALLKYPDHWDKNKEWHDYPSGMPLFIAATIITLFMMFFNGCEQVEAVETVDKAVKVAFIETEVDFETDAAEIYKVYNPSMSKSKIKHLLIFANGLGDHYDVPYEVIKSVIAAESAWKHEVRSRAGARGLMQIMPAVAKDYLTPAKFMYDPYMNMTIGVKYLSKLSKRYNQDWKKVLVAYNEGPRDIHKYSKWYITTHKYACKVLDMAFGS